MRGSLARRTTRISPKRVGRALLVVLAVGSAPTAHADAAWTETLSPAALSAALPPGSTTVLVVEAGRRDGETHDAAEALRAALRDGGKTRLVLDDAPLGEIAPLADAAIVERSLTLPVDLVVVLRLSRRMASRRAILALYDRDGRLVERLAARRGERLGPAPLPPPMPSRDAIAMAFDADVPVSLSDDAAERYIYLQRPAATGNPDRLCPLRGLDERRPITGVALYHALGREDLVASYRAKRRTRYAMLFTGLGVVAAGLATAGIMSAEGTSRAPPFIGEVVAVGGGLVALLSLAVPLHPLDASAVKKLVDDYDDALVGRKASAAPALRMGLVPTLMATRPTTVTRSGGTTGGTTGATTGGGLAIRGDF